MSRPKYSRSGEGDSGAVMTEYAILAFFVAIVMIVAVQFFGDGVRNLFVNIFEAMPF